MTRSEGTDDTRQPDPADDEREEHGGKRDRLARFYRVLTVLESRGEQGARIEDIARQVGVSKLSWASRSGARTASGAWRARASCPR
jgi:hypothetical protein